MYIFYFFIYWLLLYILITEYIGNYTHVTTEKSILYSDSSRASTWDRRCLNGSQDDWVGSPKAIGARSLISSRAVSHSPIFCGRTWILPWRDATSKTRFPGRYSAGLDDHPRHSNVANPWDARGHEFSHFIFFPSRPSLDTTSPRILISGSRSRAWMTKWNRSEMERPPVCHSHSCVTSRFSWLPKSRSGTMILGDETRWYRWLKPFWLSCGHNYAKRTEYSFSLNDLAAIRQMRGINCLYYWHSILLYYHAALTHSCVYSHNLIWIYNDFWSQI